MRIAVKDLLIYYNAYYYYTNTHTHAHTHIAVKDLLDEGASVKFQLPFFRLHTHTHTHTHTHAHTHTHTHAQRSIRSDGLFSIFKHNIATIHIFEKKQELDSTALRFGVRVAVSG